MLTFLFFALLWFWLKIWSCFPSTPLLTSLLFLLIFNLLHVFHQLIRRVPLHSFDKRPRAPACIPELGVPDPPSPCSRYTTFLLATSILLCYYLAAKVTSAPSSPSSSPPPLLPPCHPSLFSFFFFPYLAAWLAGREGKKKSKQIHWNIHGRTGPIRTHMHLWYAALPCIMHDYLYLWLLSILLFHLQSGSRPGSHTTDAHTMIFTVASWVNTSNSQNSVSS